MSCKAFRREGNTARKRFEELKIMLYLVRGKSNDQDRCLRLHAESPEEAEALGWTRGLFEYW